jgi:hypothetical protein
VRIQTRWRATTTATTTAKAKTLIRKNIDISDLLIQNALLVTNPIRSRKIETLNSVNDVIEMNCANARVLGHPSAPLKRRVSEF